MPKLCTPVILPTVQVNIVPFGTIKIIDSNYNVSGALLPLFFVPANCAESPGQLHLLHNIRKLIKNQ